MKNIPSFAQFRNFISQVFYPHREKFYINNIELWFQMLLVLLTIPKALPQHYAFDNKRY